MYTQLKAIEKKKQKTYIARSGGLGIYSPQTKHELVNLKRKENEDM